MGATQRFRLTRAGILNVWQYDEQVFHFADGRLLLRGANGAGKSKTLELLLPFALDGDSAAMEASGRRGNQLVWLMTDGIDGDTRTGYVWVEATRTLDDGTPESVTCGVGLRASAAAKRVDRWFFVSDRPVGDGWSLLEGGSPLTRDRLRDVLDGVGTVHTRAGEYRSVVGRRLFGLDPAAYDDLLRLLYWLRRPQVGEDVEPGRLAEALRGSLPAIDDEAVREVGGALDDLAAFGEQVDQTRRQVEALQTFVDVYRRYAGAVVRERATAVVDADGAVRTRQRELDRARREQTQAQADLQAAREAGQAARTREAEAAARLTELDRSPEARSRDGIRELERLATAARLAAERAERDADEALGREQRAVAAAGAEKDAVLADVAGVADTIDRLTRGAVGLPDAALAGDSPPAALPTVEPDPAGVTEWAQGAAVVGGSIGVLMRRWRGLVESLLDAVKDFARAAAAARQADDELAREETVVEEAEGRLADADRDAAGAEQRFVQALAGWVGAVPTTDMEFMESVPGVDAAGLRRALDEEPEGFVAEGAGLADSASRPTIEALQRVRAEAAHATAAAAADVRRLEAERDQVAAEAEPAPPPPALARDVRVGRSGAPLWRLVDVAPHVPDDRRAAVEAALQASGLLDAWVSPDGGALRAGTADVAVVVDARSPSVAGPSLADVLVPDVPADAGVPADIVARLLARVPLRDADTGDDTVAAPFPAVSIGVDGSFRLGPLAGEARKPAGQYLGASARVAERERRLAEIDERIATRTADRTRAEGIEAGARASLLTVQQWVAARPDPVEVVRSRLLVVERTDARDRAQARVAVAADKARAARAAGAAARQRVEARSVAAGVAPEEDLAEARRDEARSGEEQAQGTVAAAIRVQAAAKRWAARADDATRAVADAVRAADEARSLRADAVASATEFDTAREALGATIDELERSLAAARRDREAAHTDVAAAGRAEQAADRAEATAAATIATAVDHLRQAQTHHGETVAGLRDAVSVPGLLSLGIGRPPATDESTALAGHPDAALVRRLVAELPDIAPAGRNDVLAAYRALQSGPAADLDPQLTGEDVFAAAVVDPASRQPREVTAVLADLARTATENRDLLTRREQKIFEEHLLGQLGESLRSRRLDADALVRRTNEVLADVTTSQGIRVRLRWTLTDDAGPEVRTAAQLLTRPLGSLLAEESTQLRGALSRLIDASRQEDPDLPYADHLGRALDYRQWSRFVVEIHRPGATSWQPLTRRTPLSQGEQKVVCYLPLFAAAAAHFESLAGGAPHAPRFVLLDDAFPKIDARTHPLLMGLLVQLDLDFVITSERLWGTFPEVPSLAIYEALRSPDEPGIAQLEFRWDGRRRVQVT